MHPDPAEALIALLIYRDHREQFRHTDPVRPPVRRPLPLPPLRRPIGAALVRLGERLQGPAIDVATPTAPCR